jgi:hypothetical protein
MEGAERTRCTDERRHAMQEPLPEVEVYEPPALVEVGEFAEMTLGGYPGVSTDYWYTYFF